MRRFAVLLMAAAGLSAQEDTVIKVEVNLVNVLFSVRNKGGGLVGNLSQEEFQVFEDGRQQKVKSFTRETNLPLTIGLLVDVSKSQERLIEDERMAAGQFFERVLQAKDMAFLISFGAEAELLQDSTNSSRLLRKALGGLRLSVPLEGLHPGPVPTASRLAGTILYDAVSLAAVEKLRGEVGRKAIVIITDGVDQGSRYNINRAIEDAHKADAIIYSIYYADPRYRMFGGSGEPQLKKMADETGGRLFHVDRSHTLDDCFRQIQEEMRSQYAVSYTPDNPKRDGTFRKIEIRTAQKDLRVQTRKGYFAMPEGE